VQIEDTALRQVTPAPQTVPQPDKSLVIRPEWLAHHEKNLIEARSGPHDLVFVGDSITDNYHKFGPAPDQVFKPIWAKYFAPHSALNLGVSGDSTQHVLWRLEHGEVDGLSPSNVVLLIGTNNTWHDSKASAGDVTSGVEAVVKELHTRLPEAKILVIGILPTTVSTAKSSKDAEINRNLGVFYADSSFARVLDLSPLFLNPDGTVDESLFYDMPAPCKGSNCDANAPLPPRKVVHPNTVGQTRMAEAISRALFP
jgi:lysophospholipase L1-like esterase